MNTDRQNWIVQNSATQKNIENIAARESLFAYENIETVFSHLSFDVYLDRSAVTHIIYVALKQSVISEIVSFVPAIQRIRVQMRKHRRIGVSPSEKPTLFSIATRCLCDSLLFKTHRIV